MIEIIATSTFKKEFKRLNKKYPSLKNDIESFVNNLLDNPMFGIDLGNGLRKIRISIKSKLRGKQGGTRIIT